MRVVLVGSFYPPYVGGIESHMESLAAGLSGAGVTVRVVCLKDPAQSESASGPSPGQQPSRPIEIIRVAGTARIGAGWPLPLRGFDVVHFHGFSRPLFLRAVASKQPSQPLVLTPHGGLTYLDERHPLRRTAKQAFDVSCGPLLRHRVARIVALTDMEKQHIERRYRVRSGRVPTIPSPLPIDAPELSAHASWSSTGERRFLALTRLAERKNLHHLIDALERDPSLPGCDIAGPDDGAGEHLRRLAQRLPPGRVRFLEPLSGVEKARALRDAIALVLPSSWEMLSIAALEAVAAGTPIVASEAAASGLPAEAVVTFPTGSVSALVRSLHTVVDQREQLQLRVRQAAAAWPSPAQWIEQMLATYEGASR
ncbi:MAG: glycogen synthase [Frankiaceae bacterium]|nr:glycogen synthase [Frankiaceae bacterium]